MTSSVNASTLYTTYSTESATTDLSALDKDAFLRLLIAQMQNQDPLNPADNTEFVAQLAQFSSLEQLTQMNTNLEESLATNTQVADSINKASTVSYLGKTISAETADFSFDGSSEVDLQFSLDSAVLSGSLKILDSDGKTVRTIDIGGNEAGSYTCTWDGYTNKGVYADSGLYSYEIDAKDVLGEDVTWTPVFTGEVEGVSYEDGSAYLYSGGVYVPIESVTGIIETEG